MTPQETPTPEVRAYEDASTRGYHHGLAFGLIAALLAVIYVMWSLELPIPNPCGKAPL